MNKDSQHLSNCNYVSVSTRIVCQLLDLNSCNGISFAYIEIPALKLEMASNQLGYFEFTLPTHLNVTSLELWIMPLYYQYQIYSIDLSKNQVHLIYLKAHLNQMPIQDMKSKMNANVKPSFWRVLKNKLFSSLKTSIS